MPSAARGHPGKAETSVSRSAVQSSARLGRGEGTGKLGARKGAAVAATALLIPNFTYSNAELMQKTVN